MPRSQAEGLAQGLALHLEVRLVDGGLQRRLRRILLPQLQQAGGPHERDPAPGALLGILGIHGQGLAPVPGLGLQVRHQHDEGLPVGALLGRLRQPALGLPEAGSRALPLFRRAPKAGEDEGDAVGAGQGPAQDGLGLPPALEGQEGARPDQGLGRRLPLARKELEGALGIRARGGLLGRGLEKGQPFPGRGDIHDGLGRLRKALLGQEAAPGLRVRPG